MKKVLVGFAVVIVLIVAAAIAIPFLIPLETYKEEIAGQVRNATGRELTIKGDIKFSLLPQIELEVDDVAFSNAPGASTKEMVKLAKLQLRLKPMPLLSGEVVIDSFVLVDPVIQLEVDKQGRPNWAFAARPGSPADAAGAPSGAARPAETTEGGMALSELRLGDVRLVNGSITYFDARSGAKQQLSKINVRLSLPDLDSPFAGAGDVTWNGKKVEFELDIAKPRRLLAGQTTGVAVHLAAEPVKLDYKGFLTNAKPVRIEGVLDLDVPSLRAFAAWTGNPIQAPGGGLGPLSIKGKLAAAGPRMTFSDVEMALDAIAAKGELLVDAGKARPYLKARLDVARLDLNPYLPPEKPDGATAKAGGPAPKTAAGWSDDPIDLSALRGADADFALSVGSIALRKIEVGKSVLTVQLKNGRLTADLTELALYEGSGRGRIVLDGAGRVAAVETTFKLAGVQAEPLLRDAAGFERLSGSAEADLALRGRGRSQRELIGTLNGRGAVTFADGAIKGINLGTMVRNVSSAFLDSKARETQKTDFSELSGTYTITNGIVKNTDLALKSPLLRLSGAGTVDLPRRTVNYRVEPKLALTTEGQGGRQDVSGIMVPVVITGPWDNLSYRPDLGGMVKEQLKDPGKVLESVKGLLRGMTRPGTSSEPATEEAEPTPAPAPITKPLEDALKGLFGR